MPYVRELKLYAKRYDMSIMSYPIPVSTLPYFPLVKNITLECHAGEFSNAELFWLKEQMSSLITLNLSLCIRSLDYLLGLISSGPSLQSLTLSNYTELHALSQQEVDEIFDRHIPPPIDILTLSYDSGCYGLDDDLDGGKTIMVRLAEWVISHPTHMTLRTFRSGMLDVYTSPVLQTCINALGPSLEHFGLRSEQDWVLGDNTSLSFIPI